MATRAFDVATILKAFVTLDKEKGIGEWKSVNDFQEKIFALLDKYGNQIEELADLTCKVEVVSALELVVVAILDKKIKWLEGIARDSKVIFDDNIFSAFKLDRSCAIFQISDFCEPLLRINTQSGDKLWIMMHEELNGVELFFQALSIMESEKRMHPDYEMSPTAIIPDVKFKLQPDIHLLNGSKSGNTDWQVVKATQEFELNIDRRGVQVKVETRMTLFRCCFDVTPRKEKIVVNKPFIGWFTQGESLFPLAVFYADSDSWKKKM